MLPEETTVDERCLERDSGGFVNKRLPRGAFSADRFRVHAGACASASACPAREFAFEGQSSAGQNEAACVQTDMRAVGSE